MRVRSTLVIASLALGMVSAATHPARAAGCAIVGVPFQKCDTAYAPAPSVNQKFDIFWKAGSSPRPAVILVHSGGWINGDKKDFAAKNAIVKPLVDAGFVVINMNFRLANADATLQPGETNRAYSDQPADAESVIRWAKGSGRASPYNINPSRIALLGVSTGGQIALLVALRNSTSPSLKVKAIVSWVGPTDLVKHAAYIEAAGSTVGKSWAGGCSVAACPGRYQAYSPLTYASAQNPATLMVHDVADTVVLYSQSTELNDAQVASGSTASYLLPVSDPACNSHDTVHKCAVVPSVGWLRNHL
ncbi:MAG: hypothetical protein QOG53_1655 [Frankiales bacterium]|jgi:acetyl esterase/lipase|nr:hypothetical protein [Frankiales bacterium]